VKPAIPLAVAAVLVGAAACSRSEPARLEVRALATAAADDAVTARFQLKNVGAQPLTLDGVVSACGCAPTAPLADALAPGAAQALDVRCTMPRVDGPVVRELRLRSSDPSHPETAIPVTLQGKGGGPEPAALYFGYVAVGASETRDVVLPHGATAAPPARGDVTVEPLPARPDGAHGVRVRFTPQAPGIVRTSVALGANAGTLPIAAVAYDRVLALPSEVHVPRPSGAPGLPSITLVGRGPGPLAIADVDYPDGLTGDLRTIVPGQQYRLVLRGRPAIGADPAIRVRGARGEELLAIPVAIPFAGPARPAT
jgi:hypothetical protein